MGTYIFFTFVAMQVSIIGLAGRDLAGDHGPHTNLGRWLAKTGWLDADVADIMPQIHAWDSYCMVFDFLTLSLTHIVLLGYCSFFMRRAENRKPMDEPFSDNKDTEDVGSGWYDTMESETSESD